MQYICDAPGAKTWFRIDDEGKTLVTAMLPPGGEDDPHFRIIVVGPENRDPYPEHGDAIGALGGHLGLVLNRDRCYPYR
jgi:hypothetical protein